MKKILFVTYGGVHANIARIMYTKLCTTYDIKILALTTAINILKKAGVSYSMVKDYIDEFEYKEDIIRYGKILAEKEYNPDSGMNYEECVAYLGVGFYELVKKNKSEELAWREFEKHGRKAFCPDESMQRIIEREHPDAVCVSCDARMERAAGIAANRLGIPVLMILDLPELDRRTLFFKADICVMNEYAKIWMLNNTDLEDKQIHVTGQPVLEDNTKIDSMELMKTKCELAVNNYKNVIVYLEQPGYVDSNDIENLLLEMSKDNKENLYIIKLHPNQENREYHSVMGNYIVTRNMNLKALLGLSNIAITGDSNSGIEAFMLDNVLLTVSINQKLGIDFSEYGISKKSVSLIELRKDIEEACLNSHNFVEKYVPNRNAFANIENASENIGKVIRNLLQ